MGQKAALKRELGLLEVTLSGVGIILGAGIYALIGKAAGLAGNALWISVALAAFIAIFTASTLVIMLVCVIGSQKKLSED